MLTGLTVAGAAEATMGISQTQISKGSENNTTLNQRLTRARETPLTSIMFSPMLLFKLPFLLHLIIETPAAYTFFFSPERQLHDCSPAARLILQQHGALLAASNLICIPVCVKLGMGDTDRMIAFALGFYHIWPCRRAYRRLSRVVVPGDVNASAVLGGPMVHLAVHLVLLGMFAYTASAGI